MGLANALTTGATSALDQQALNLREVVKEKARKEAQARQDRLDAQKEELEQAKLLASGVTPASTKITLANAPTDEPPPPSDFDAAMTRIGTANGMPTAPARGPFAGPGPVRLPKMPVLDVQETPATFDPSKSAAGSLEAQREKARADALQKTLESRESEGQLNRESREAISANHERIRQAKLGELHGRAVTGTARLQHIARMARQYMQPTYLGGLGLNPTLARSQATQDIDDIIASAPPESGGTGTPLPKAPVRPNAFLPAPGPVVDPGGDIDLSKPVGFSGSPPPADPIDVAVQHLKDKTGTLAQLMASNKSAAFKAEVKRRAGIQ